MNTALHGTVNIVIETNRLMKRYGTVTAVDAVSLRVARGEIYGFLGLNGAGKTTTIRALLGMIRPSSGGVSLFGAPIGPGGRGPWGRVGHLVETPAAYPELTVRENLEVARRLHAVVDRGATIRAIDRFGLAQYADRPARTLSMGNLQRLGLARALLHEPELLVLDEPANGLDPAGVVEVRELLRALARDRGVTVFMSSHNLAEVDRLATRIGIIHAGRLIEELDMHALERRRARRLAVDARDRVAARAALEAAGYAVSLVGEDGSLLLREPRAITAPDEVARLLVAAGTPPIRLAVEQDDLEQHFLRLTGGAMTLFRAALWAEALKARRSKVPWLTALGFSLAPLVGGLFMIILKDPERARSMGLISAKAQLAAGVADWATMLSLLAQATAVGGGLLFTLVTIWVFGREFSDHTAKELLALPTPRAAIVAAKFVVVGIWAVGLTALVMVLGLIVGAAIGLPGWSELLLWRASGALAVTAVLTLALMPPVALLASAGRGYLPPLGWAFLTFFLAQILAAIGWGAWFPWSVPALFSEIAGPRAAQIGPQSYVLVGLTCAAGLAGTFAWWHSADQTR